MLKKFASLVVVSLLVVVTTQAQIRDIPSQVKDAFAIQYPQADNVSYKDYLTSVAVKFTQNGNNMIARYDNQGIWKETEKTASFEEMPQDVRDGLQKSKYADWKVEETAIINYPANEIRYRIKVSKNDIQKKYLYFNKNGRLVRDAITI